MLAFGCHHDPSLRHDMFELAMKHVTTRTDFVIFVFVTEVYCYVQHSYVQCDSKISNFFKKHLSL